MKHWENYERDQEDSEGRKIARGPEEAHGLVEGSLSDAGVVVRPAQVGLRVAPPLPTTLTNFLSFPLLCEAWVIGMAPKTRF